MAAEATLHIVFPVIIGIVIGLIEAFFVMRDETSASGAQMFHDLWHGPLFAVIFTLIACNVPWLLSMISLPGWINSILFVDEMGRSIVIGIVITLILKIKMVSAHAIKGVPGAGFKEKWYHMLIVAALVGFSPYYVFPLYEVDFIAGLAESIPFF
jgi:hypothetical protein